jgi:hypothetical protein
MDDTDIPDFATLATDPAIAALLNFEPAPVKPRAGGWDADAQRAYIAFLAITGSKTRAANATGRAPNGIDQILKRDDSDSFIQAHHAALALYRRNNAAKLAHGVAAACKADPAVPAPGQILNEDGEWEDEESYRSRGEEAFDRIGTKLRRSRRLFLHDISDCPAKRAAFEILTELPVDWELAAQMQPQPDEPWRKPNMRQPDMLLTAENGWLGRDFVHGPDRKAELLRDMNAWRAERGLPAVGWKGEGETEE